VTGRQRRRCKQLLDGVIEKLKYWNLKEEALDLSVCGELAREVCVDLSYDRLCNEWLTAQIMNLP